MINYEKNLINTLKCTDLCALKEMNNKRKGWRKKISNKIMKKECFCLNEEKEKIMKEWLENNK